MPRPPKKAIQAIADALPDFEDDDLAGLTLLDHAMSDPARGLPWNVAPDGEPEEWIEPGAWAWQGYIHRKTRLPLNCPVQPLGKLKDMFYFLNTLGEVHELAANAGKGNIDALFAGRAAFLEWAWPRWSMPKNKSETARVVNWQAEEARQALFAACAFKGTFELNDKVRGKGAWRDDDGGLIYHAGDAVWIGGQWHAPGEHGRFIYPARPKIERPADGAQVAGPHGAGAIVLSGLRSWIWDRPELDARLALGWLMTAMVGGGLSQRPVLWLVGGEGTGKSTLQMMFRLLMNGALIGTSNTTQAGIYQKVAQDSIAVLVDEQEAKSDSRTTDKIIELARVAYSGDKMFRGGDKGVGQEFSVQSSFLFSSIAQPAMGAQDESRMAVCMLRERPEMVADDNEDAEPALDPLSELGLRDSARCKVLGRALLKRMVDWHRIDAGRTRWERLLEAFRGVLMKMGHQARAADTFGALAAGYHAAMSDAMPTFDELVEWGQMLRPRDLAETANREKTWERCFWLLLEAAPEALRQAHHKSLGAAVLDFREAGTSEALERLERTAGALGMALSFPKGCDRTFAHARLFVPLKHPSLTALFEGSEWAGKPGAPGPWGGVLRQMPPALFKVGVCDKGLHAAAKGLMITLAAVLAPGGGDEEGNG